MNIFHRYVIKEHIAPFFFAFSVIMFVLILKLMLQLMDMLITRGVGIIVMAQLLVYNLAWMVALVVPMSVLISSLMAFGRMGASGEITAMKAAGISMYRIVSPVFLLSILLTIIMIWFNTEILPVANYRASSLAAAIRMKKPMLSLKNREGQFINDLPNTTIRVDSIDYDTGEMSGVTLFKRDSNKYETTIIAKKGRFETYPSGDKLAMVLHNGEIHREQLNQSRYIRNSFDEFRQLIKVNFALDTTRQSSKSDRTKTTAEMKEDIERGRARIASFRKSITLLSEGNPEVDDEASTNMDADIRKHERLIANELRQINEYLVEIHKKNSIPVAAMVFVLIGAALGILVKRSGASIGIGVSIGFFALYYLFLIGGESAGDHMILEPWLTMWLPNFVFGLVGIALMIYSNRR
jgi:lipopolysaccharide export system permease protein